MSNNKVFFDKISITQELIISVTAVICLMLSILGFIVVSELIKINEDKLFWQKKSNIQIATNLLIDPIWTVDTNNIKNAATTFVEGDNQILALRVLDEYDEVLAESRRSALGNQKFEELIKSKDHFVDGGEILRFGERIGRIEVIYSTKEFKKKLMLSIFKIGFLFLIVGASFGLVILWRLKKTITGPVNRIVEGSIKIARGDYRFQVEEEFVQEFQKIAQALNGAIRAINERDQELKRQIVYAQQATIAKSNFVSSVSHEIRTPLNAIIGLTELTLDSKLDCDQKENLETIKLSADSLLSIINDILDFSKIEANRLELEFLNFNFKELLLDCERILALAAQKKNIKLNLSFSAGTQDFVGDPFRIKQILLNLMNNAIKFTPEGGLIEVRSKITDVDSQFALLRVEVADNGIGIDKEKIGNLFEPFIQEDQSTTRKFGGTGLGLSISKKLIDLMDGLIGVESQLKVGSTFWFEIRLRKLSNN